MNEKALISFMEETDKAVKLSAAITEALADHLGESPEKITWGHVGSVRHVVALLEEINSFLNIKGGN